MLVDGKEVTLEGRAANAKAGAVVIIDGEPIYLPKLPAWPDTTNGKQVIVKGTLKHPRFIPSPVVNAKGEVSQGAEREQWVLDASEWKPRPGK